MSGESVSVSWNAAFSPVTLARRIVIYRRIGCDKKALVAAKYSLRYYINFIFFVLTELLVPARGRKLDIERR